jgi:dihydroorotase
MALAKYIIRGNFVEHPAGLRPLQVVVDRATGTIVAVEEIDRALLQNVADARGYTEETADDALIYTMAPAEIIFGGMGDLHVHAREDVSQKLAEVEDFASIGRAAVKGGVCFIGEMPNNPCPPLDAPTYLAKLALAAKATMPVFLYAALTDTSKPLPWPVPYKAFLTAPDLKMALTKKDNLAAYRGAWISFHGEDHAILGQNKAAATHQARRPVAAEVQALKNILAWSKEFALFVRICHVTSQAGIELLSKAKEDPFYQEHLSVEVCLNHLCFDAENTDLANPYFNVNPPLRTKADRMALWQAWRDGVVDVLATDHAPHPLAAKAAGASGMPSLDCFAAILTQLYHEALTSGMAAQEILKRMAQTTVFNPGAFINHFLPTWQRPELAKVLPAYQKLGRGLGKILPGYAGYFTVINFNRGFTCNLADLGSKMPWSPWLGHHFPGSLTGIFTPFAERFISR